MIFSSVLSALRVSRAEMGEHDMKKLFISQAVAGVLLIALAVVRLIIPTFLDTFDTINFAAALYIGAAAGVIFLFALLFFLNRKVISYYLGVFGHTLIATYLLITIYQLVAASAFNQVLPIAQSMVLVMILALIAAASIGCLIALLKRLFG